MNYTVTIPNDIKDDERIVLPISMNQPLERGEKLNSILKSLTNAGYKEQTTILICDYLNRHNCNSESDSLIQGQNFIKDHHDMLSGFKLWHWADFIESCGEKFISTLSEIKKASSEGTRFYNKIVKTWQKCLSADQSLESSVLYQQEEYAAILCMTMFDHLIYPKRITNGIAQLYSQFQGKKPTYHHIKISEHKKNDESIKKSESIHVTKDRRHVHVAFRALLDHAEQLLKSSELSTKSKQVFGEEMENLLMSHQLISSEISELFTKNCEFEEQKVAIN